MATIDNYKIKITVDGQDKVVDLMDTVDELQSTITTAAAAGIAAFTALATSAVRMADDMVDLSKATGFTVGEIYKLSTALEASGGKFDDSGKFIQSFSRLLGQVEQGSKEAIDGLTKLGLTRSQIENLSDEELYKAVINGLAGMEDGFERTRIATEIFGKSAATVDFKQLADGLKGSVDPEVERNLLLAADAVGSLETAFRNLQIAALSAIAPILQGIKDLNFTAEDAKTAVQVLGALVAAAFAAGTVVQIAKIVKLVKDLGGAMRAAGAASAFLVGLSGVGLLAVAASAAAATAAYVALGKAMEGAADEKAQLEGTVATPAAPGAGPQRTVGETPEERAAKAAQRTTEEFIKQNKIANDQQRILNSLIGQENTIASIKRSNAQIDADAAKQKIQLEGQIQAELSKGKDANMGVVAALKNQLTELENNTAARKKLSEEEIRSLAINKNILNAIDLQYARLEAVAIMVDDFDETQIRNKVIQGKLTEKNAARALELDKLARQGANQLRSLQKQIDIAKEKGDDDTVKRLQDLQTAVNERYTFEEQKLINKYENEDKLLESWKAGTVQAFQQIANATKPYQQAQDAIMATWGKIGSAVDNFVETGKFKFKDFAASVIQDIAKIIIKAQLLKAIQATLGFFGIPLPGLAEGGQAKAGQPYIVGEKGPELFVPKNAGTVIPNNKIGAAGQAMATGSGAVSAPVTNNYITNNINAVDAQSVAQLFANNRKTLLGSVKMAEKEMPYMA